MEKYYSSLPERTGKKKLLQGTLWSNRPISQTDAYRESAAVLLFVVMASLKRNCTWIFPTANW